MHDLLNSCRIEYAGALVTAANNTDSNSSRFDMKGYDGILFITTITDSASDGVATLKVEGNTTDSDSGMALISGATKSATSAVDDDLNGMLLIVDVYQPQKRYVQGVRVSATDNIAFGEIHAIRYGPSKRPVTQSTTTVAGSVAVVG